MTISRNNPPDDDVEQQPAAGGEVGPGPPAPPATPANVQRDRVPPPHAADPSQRQPRGGIRLRKKYAIPPAVLAAVAFVVVIVANPGGSDKKTSVVNPPRPSISVTVSLAGAGSGEVRGSGIACPSTCTTTYSSETSVSLTASPGNGSTFGGWTGGTCSGTGTCELLVGSATTVTATFAKNVVPTKPAYPPTELTFADDEGKVIDKEPIENNTSNEDFFIELRDNTHYFHVEGPTQGSGRVASWKGHGTPTFPGCTHALEASSERQVPFKRPGEWICAETYKGSIALLRYEGPGEAERTSKFYAIVYPPHG